MPATGSIKAGAAYVELFLKNNRFVRGLSQSGARLKRFGASIMRIGATVTAAGGMIVGPILAAAKSFAAAGDKLDKMSARTGLAVEFLSELGHAAQLGGTDIETMEKSVRKLQTAALDANDGLKTYKDLFDKLGVTVTDTNGDLKATPELFEETIVALSKLENHTEKAAIANKLFGRSGTALLPMLKEGKEGLAAAMEEARRLGLVLTTEDATAAAKLTDAWTRMKAVMHAAWIRVGGAVADMLTKLANRTAELGAKVVDFVKQNQPLIVALFKIGAAVMAAGAAISLIGAGIFGLGVTLGGLAAIAASVAAVVGMIGSALAALLSPVGLVAAAVVGLGAYFLKTSGQGQQALDWLAGVFGRLKERALSAFQGIRDAMAAGDLKLAARVLWAALAAEWERGVNWLNEKWINFKEQFATVWNDAVYGLAGAFTNAIAILERTWVKFTGWFMDKWKKAEETVAAGIAVAIAHQQGLDPAEVLGNLRQNYSRQAGDRQKKQADRLAEIETGRAGALGAIAEDRQRAQAERRAKFEAQRADAAGRLQQAETELAATLEEARQAAIASQTAGYAADFAAAMEGAAGAGGGADSATAAASKIAGTFSAAAAVRLGNGGNAQERMATGIEAIEQNTRPMRRGKPLTWS